ncbi:MAG: hypothetical protein Q7U34_07225, partial [Anaerolineales bacterium]|nr:hypothetical protein [Anaerolineales bacterium]
MSASKLANWPSVSWPGLARFDFIDFYRFVFISELQGITRKEFIRDFLFIRPVDDPANQRLLQPACGRDVFIIGFYDGFFVIEIQCFHIVADVCIQERALAGDMTGIRIAKDNILW